VPRVQSVPFFGIFEGRVASLKKRLPAALGWAWLTSAWSRLGSEIQRSRPSREFYRLWTSRGSSSAKLWITIIHTAADQGIPPRPPSTTSTLPPLHFRRPPATSSLPLGKKTLAKYLRRWGNINMQAGNICHQPYSWGRNYAPDHGVAVQNLLNKLPIHRIRRSLEASKLCGGKSLGAERGRRNSLREYSNMRPVEAKGRACMTFSLPGPHGFGWIFSPPSYAFLPARVRLISDQMSFAPT